MAVGFARISNVHNMKPLPPLRWLYPLGDLGLFTEHDTFSYELRLATSNSLSNTITGFSVVSGTLPPGLTLNAGSGEISGTFGWVDGQETFTFTIEVEDNLENTIQGTFSITVKEFVTEVQWLTPEGELLDQGLGGGVFINLKAKSVVV